MYYVKVHTLNLNMYNYIQGIEHSLIFMILLIVLNVLIQQMSTSSIPIDLVFWYQLMIMSNFTSTFIETLNYTTELIVNSTVNTIQNDNLLFIITPLAMALKHTTIKPPIHEEISPVTLNQTWSPLTRLIFLTILSVIGSVGNVFMISSVMIEDHLKKAGNTNNKHFNLITFSFFYLSLSLSSSFLIYAYFFVDLY